MKDKQLLTRIGYCILHAILTNGREDQDDWEATKQWNARDGWSFDTSAPLGGITRREGVQLSETRLRIAFEYAEKLFDWQHIHECAPALEPEIEMMIAQGA